MRFRSQIILLHVFNATLHCLLAAVFTWATGCYWWWAVPATIILLTPSTWRMSLVVVDEVGVQVGGKTQLRWQDVDQLVSRGWFGPLFMLKDGSRKRLYTGGWPGRHRESFYELVKQKNL